MGNVLKKKRRNASESPNQRSSNINNPPAWTWDTTNQTNIIDDIPSALYKQTVSLLQPGTELCVKKPRFPNQIQGFNTISGLLTGKFIYFFTYLENLSF